MQFDLEDAPAVETVPVAVATKANNSQMRQPGWAVQQAVVTSTTRIAAKTKHAAAASTPHRAPLKPVAAAAARGGTVIPTALAGGAPMRRALLIQRPAPPVPAAAPARHAAARRLSGASDHEDVDLTSIRRMERAVDSVRLAAAKEVVRKMRRDARERELRKAAAASAEATELAHEIAALEDVRKKREFNAHEAQREARARRLHEAEARHAEVALRLQEVRLKTSSSGKAPTNGPSRGPVPHASGDGSGGAPASPAGQRRRSSLRSHSSPPAAVAHPQELPAASPRTAAEAKGKPSGAAGGGSSQPEPATSQQALSPSAGADMPGGATASAISPRARVGLNATRGPTRQVPSALMKPLQGPSARDPADAPSPTFRSPHSSSSPLSKTTSVLASSSRKGHTGTASFGATASPTVARTAGASGGSSEGQNLTLGSVSPDFVDRTLVLRRPLQIHTWQQPAALKEMRVKMRQVKEAAQLLDELQHESVLLSREAAEVEALLALKQIEEKAALAALEATKASLVEEGLHIHALDATPSTMLGGPGARRGSISPKRTSQSSPSTSHSLTPMLHSSSHASSSTSSPSPQHSFSSHHPHTSPPSLSSASSASAPPDGAAVGAFQAIRRRPSVTATASAPQSPSQAQPMSGAPSPRNSLDSGSAESAMPLAAAPPPLQQQQLIQPRYAADGSADDAQQTTGELSAAAAAAAAATAAAAAAAAAAATVAAAAAVAAATAATADAVEVAAIDDSHRTAVAEAEHVMDSTNAVVVQSTSDTAPSTSEDHIVNAPSEAILVGTAFTEQVLPCASQPALKDAAIDTIASPSSLVVSIGDLTTSTEAPAAYLSSGDGYAAKSIAERRAAKSSTPVPKSGTEVSEQRRLLMQFTGLGDPILLPKKQPRAAAGGYGVAAFSTPALASPLALDSPRMTGVSPGTTEDDVVVPQILISEPTSSVVSPGPTGGAGDTAAPVQNESTSSVAPARGPNEPITSTIDFAVAPTRLTTDNGDAGSTHASEGALLVEPPLTATNPTLSAESAIAGDDSDIITAVTTAAQAVDSPAAETLAIAAAAASDGAVLAQLDAPSELVVSAIEPMDGSMNSTPARAADTAAATEPVDTLRGSMSAAPTRAEDTPSLAIGASDDETVGAADLRDAVAACEDSGCANASPAAAAPPASETDIGDASTALPTVAPTESIAGTATPGTGSVVDDGRPTDGISVGSCALSGAAVVVNDIDPLPVGGSAHDASPSLHVNDNDSRDRVDDLEALLTRASDATGEAMGFVPPVEA